MSSARRDLIKKAGDAPDASIPDDDKIRALDRAIDALRSQAPGKTDMVAESVGLTEQLKPEIREALLHA
jgi:hypothetical protein